MKLAVYLEGRQGVEAHADGGDDDEGDGEEGDDLGGQGGVRLLKQVPQSPGQKKTHDNAPCCI